MLVMSETQDLELDDITLRSEMKKNNLHDFNVFLYFRFKTLEPNGLLLALRDDQSAGRRRDAVELAMSAGSLMVSISMAGN